MIIGGQRIPRSDVPWAHRTGTTGRRVSRPRRPPSSSSTRAMTSRSRLVRRPVTVTVIVTRPATRRRVSRPRRPPSSSGIPAMMSRSRLVRRPVTVTVTRRHRASYQVRQGCRLGDELERAALHYRNAFERRKTVPVVSSLLPTMCQCGLVYSR
jgi:hypothetical protein